MREWGVLIPILSVCIPIIALLLIPLKQWLRLKEKQMEMTSQLTAEKTAQYAAHTERLEQRVRVLERIITDKGTGLADQIEQLRDPPRLDKPLN
jgi:ABC-type phosphate transport system auxiliary subunit